MKILLPEKIAASGIELYAMILKWMKNTTFHLKPCWNVSGNMTPRL